MYRALDIAAPRAAPREIHDRSLPYDPLARAGPVSARNRRGLVACNGGGDGKPLLKGSLRSGSAGLAGYTVSLYASLVDRADGWEFLGSASSEANGDFQISYDPPAGRAVLIIEADRGPVTLASAIGYGADVPVKVVVNERTTVAAGNAFAQFINGRRVAGNAIGMLNAVRMAGNLAHPGTGDAGSTVSRTPNGGENSTFATFNSLANAVAACVASDRACTDLFAAAKPPGRAAPRQRAAGRGQHRQEPVVPGLSQ